MPRICFPLAAACLAVATLSACSGTVRSQDDFLGFITPYRIEVVQGNVVTQEMLAQLRAGLTREQVRYVLGSPLLTDVFHADRWDYVFSIRRQGTPAQERRVTVYFEQDRVSRFDASALPSEREIVASIDTRKAPAKPRVLELTPEQVGKLPPPAPQPVEANADAAAPVGAKRAYPPLESTPTP
jgi:outer membrane protein assembly factor BamE